MSKQRKKYTIEELIEIASKYQSRSALQKGSASCYNIIRKKQIEHLAFAHMVRLHEIWTPEKILLAVKKYSHKSQLMRAEAGLYKAVLLNKLQDKAFAHMKRPSPHNQKWLSDTQILLAAQKYTTMRQLMDSDPGLYGAICRRKLVVLVKENKFTHVPKKSYKYRSDDVLLLEAQKYQTIQALRTEAMGVYLSIVRRGLSSKAFNHMQKSKGLSSQEMKISEFLNEFNIFHIQKKRIDQNGKSYKEIDIYIPELNLGIEYCGLYWHNELSKQPRYEFYHFHKMQSCHSQNIKLITIFSDEWIDKEYQVRAYLRSVFGKNSIKIPARKCIIKSIKKNTSKEFIDRYHIQGATRNILQAFGLFNKEELVGVMTLGKHHRQGNSSLVLSRLCFKENTTVVGGASKLFKTALVYAQANRYKKIISWSDNRWSEGNIYKVLGFILEKEYGPDYSYVLVSNTASRFSKQSKKKTPEERLTGKTEKELREAQGFARIWDCGKKTWVFNVPSQS